MSFPTRPPRGSAFIAGLFGVPYPPPGLVNMEDYRPNSLNQPPRFKNAIKTGKPLIGTGIGIASVAIAKVTAALGFDWVFIDAEHTPMGPDLMAELIKTVNYYSEGATAAVVRLPTHGHEWIAWALDAGAAGIVLPHTETVEQVRHVVDAARFAPHGNRSYPPFAQFPGFTDGTPDNKIMLDVWNDNAAIIVQLESALGAQNAEAICAVPGVDAVMIGTGDLRLNMRLPFGFDGPEPEYQGAIAAIENAAKANSLPLMGFALGQQMLEAKLSKGYSLLMVAADMLALVGGQAGALQMGRAVVSDAHKTEQTKSQETLTNGVTKKAVVNGAGAPQTKGIVVNGHGQ